MHNWVLSRAQCWVLVQPKTGFDRVHPNSTHWVYILGECIQKNQKKPNRLRPNLMGSFVNYLVLTFQNSHRKKTGSGVGEGLVSMSQTTSSKIRSRSMVQIPYLSLSLFLFLINIAVYEWKPSPHFWEVIYEGMRRDPERRKLQWTWKWIWSVMSTVGSGRQRRSSKTKSLSMIGNCNSLFSLCSVPLCFFSPLISPHPPQIFRR